MPIANEKQAWVEVFLSPIIYLEERGYTLHGNGHQGVLAKRDGAVVYRGRRRGDGLFKWSRFLSGKPVGDLVDLVADEERLSLRDAIDRVVSLELNRSARLRAR